jgi:hypothetical protein
MAGLVPAIHVFLMLTNVDARHKAGHDEHYCLKRYACPRTQRQLCRGTITVPLGRSSCSSQATQSRT